MAAIDSGDAFEEVLAECEDQKIAVRRARLRLRKLRHAQIVGGAVALLVLALIGAPSRQGGAHLAISIFIAILVLVAALVVRAALVVPLRRKIAVDELVMLDAVDRLRELFINLARQEGWGGDRLQATRKRLAAFPIEGG